MLQVLYDDDGLVVTEVTMQEDIANLIGRGARLDAKCIMGNGDIRNIEVQRSRRDDDLRRMRFNASLLTSDYTPKGTDFRDVKDVYVAYITEYDPFGRNKTVYNIDSVIRETGETVDDGLYRKMVNTKVHDGSRITRLMAHFMQADFTDDEFPETSRQIAYYKHTPEGEGKMSDAVKEMLENMIEERQAAEHAEFEKKLTEKDAEIARLQAELAKR